ncbi:MAG: hypothetical protein WCC18_17160 [Candidatus Acidiferrales bacterium]
MENITSIVQGVSVKKTKAAKVAIDGAATVNSVRLTKDESERAKKADTLVIKEHHKKFEANVSEFSVEFRRVHGEVKEVYGRLKAVHTTSKAFIEANRELIEEVFEFFAHNKNKKEKQTLNGHVNGEAWSLAELGVTYDYVHRVFKKANGDVLVFDDGSKLLPPLQETGETPTDWESESDSDSDTDETTTEAPIVESYPIFANKLATSTITRITSSSYSFDEKKMVVRVLLNQLLAYVKEIEADRLEEASSAPINSGFKIETDASVQEILVGGD